MKCGEKMKFRRKDWNENETYIHLGRYLRFRNCLFWSHQPISSKQQKLFKERKTTAREEKNGKKEKQMQNNNKHAQKMGEHSLINVLSQPVQFCHSNIFCRFFVPLIFCSLTLWIEQQAHRVCIGRCAFCIIYACDDVNSLRHYFYNVSIIWLKKALWLRCNTHKLY